MNFDITIFEVDTTKNMVNLTKIAKAFGKDVNQWKRLPSTAAFLDAWKQINPSCENHITVMQGGNSEQGTWSHREIALKFAQWISPAFEVFCIKKLDELFQTGKVELQQKPISTLELFELSLRQMREQEARLVSVEHTQVALLEKVNDIDAKQTLIDTDYYALSGYYRLSKRTFDLTNVQAQQTGKTLRRKSDELGYVTKEAYHEKYGTVKTYHKFVLQAVLGF